MSEKKDEEKRRRRKSASNSSESSSEDEEEVFRLSFGTRELLLGGLAGPPPLAFLLSPLAGAT